jgi:hypothetical protein
MYQYIYENKVFQYKKIVYWLRKQKKNLFCFSLIHPET